MTELLSKEQFLERLDQAGFEVVQKTVPVSEALTAYVISVVNTYRAVIDKDAGLLSLLYDVDLLPEQLLHVLSVNPNAVRANCLRMSAICELWKERLSSKDATDV